MTQENKHTSAPWFRVQEDIYSDLCIDTTGDYDLVIATPLDKSMMLHAPEILAEMEKLAQALEDTGFEPEQSFYDVIKKARGM